jgi:sarcosine oxidase subunit alpha
VSGQVNRLDVPFGAAIDRGRRIAFTFEGERFEGYAGDTVASALAANGQWILSRSFKYHRPRGILTMAGQDANTLVQLPREPNALADRVLITEGLEVTSQNVAGSLGSDRMAMMGWFSRFLPVGFYYKAFFRPRFAWAFWEPFFRRWAGLGRLSEDATYRYYDKAYGWHDIVVVGGGPAGLSAALEAAAAGADVALIDENPQLGGSLAYARADADAASLLREMTEAVAAQPAITVMTDAICNGWFADNWLPVVRGHRLYKLRARQVVFATGAMEQPLVFRNNDLPGVMMASAAQRLLRQYGVRPGHRAVVVTANEQGYDATLDLVEAGCEVVAVLDLRDHPPKNPSTEAARAQGIAILPGWTVYEAVATPGNRHVRGTIAARIKGRGQVSDERRTFNCDLVCMSVGFAPTYQLLAHAGGQIEYSSQASTFLVRQVPKDIHVAGALNASYRLQAAMVEGRHAGGTAAKALGLRVGKQPAIPEERGQVGHSHPCPVFPHPRGKDFVDFDEDLTVADLRNAIAEGYDNIELVKRYSTVGMGPSQGRHSALNTIRIAAEATGRAEDAIGHTTARPPFAAEAFGVLAGRAFDPMRRTPMHHRHIEAGAQMMAAGAWLRPAYYGRPADRERLVRDEALAVHCNVGLIDVSTLGKMEIRGPDATVFLERMYTFAYANQPVGRSRYVLMTDEAGTIIDDGVACRLDEHHFYVTATTGGADSVYREMLRRNAMWQLDVDITNVAAAFAAVNLAGPLARELLTPLCAGLDLSKKAFPYLAVRQGEVAGMPARLFRVGFVGELGYEIHVPSGYGEALWDKLMEAGRPFDIVPFGVEAQRLLRLEKGHIIVGQDTDGLTIPQEAAMAWAIARRKPYFIGKRALEIQERRGIARTLVGFELAPDAPLPEECHLTLLDGKIAGRVTSVARSRALDKVIGLAYVDPEQAEPGGFFDIKIAQGRIIKAKVVTLPFYDPDNARQEM